MAELNTQITVADLVTERPSRSRFFERLGIDYCCGGKRPIEEVCAERGLDARTLLDTLAAAEAAEKGDGLDAGFDPGKASPAELVKHIVDVHHAYLKRELPRLSEIADHVVEHHGERESRLARTAAALKTLRADLEAHTETEERELFPALVDPAEIDGRKSAGASPSTLELLLSLEGEHQAAGALLEEIRGLTDGYTVPEWGCNTFRAFYDGLHELEIDIHQHVHKENNILFPAVRGGK